MGTNEAMRLVLGDGEDAAARAADQTKQRVSGEVDAAAAAAYREKFAQMVEELTGEARVTEAELEELVKANTFDTLPATLERVNRAAKTMSEREAWETLRPRLSQADRALLGWGDHGFLQGSGNASASTADGADADAGTGLAGEPYKVEEVCHPPKDA